MRYGLYEKNDYVHYSKDELIEEIIKAKIETEKIKLDKSEEKIWCGKGIMQDKDKNFEIVFVLSKLFPVQKLCELMDLNRSSYYKWKYRLLHPSEKLIQRERDIELFKKYHNRYPNHGYRWLNAKIKLDIGTHYSDNYAQRVCSYAGIKSMSKRFLQYTKNKNCVIYPNLLLGNKIIDNPMEVIVSDMTAFKCKGIKYELTLYMDLFNNEIIAYGLNSGNAKKGQYYNGLYKLFENKNNTHFKTILHTDRGKIYSSKEYNDLLEVFNIQRSMSRGGFPTDNGNMESINGWIKEELFNDFHVSNVRDIERCVKEYIYFFNNYRPAYTLNYLTPKEYKEKYCVKLSIK